MSVANLHRIVEVPPPPFSYSMSEAEVIISLIGLKNSEGLERSFFVLQELRGLYLIFFSAYSLNYLLVWKGYSRFALFAF